MTQSNQNGSSSTRNPTAAPAPTRTVYPGGQGKMGRVVVQSTDGAPVVELIGGQTEAIVSVGDRNHPGRVSLFGNKGEAMRLDAATGDILLFNADFAEEFDLAVPNVEPGTVVILREDGRLAPSSEAYDTRVTGVVSGAGAYRPGLILDRRDTGAPRAPIALMGKVYCWIDASEHPVRPGDLLTTSATPGHAMKVTDRTRALGAIVGKALAPLARGRALAPILVATR